eukprot:1159458-Pelagomonas_calceolata.AAC.4
MVTEDNLLEKSREQVDSKSILEFSDIPTLQSFLAQKSASCRGQITKKPDRQVQEPPKRHEDMPFQRNRPKNRPLPFYYN